MINPGKEAITKNKKNSSKTSQDKVLSPMTSNARMARQLEELRRGSESNSNLGTPKADAELNKRMQKLFDEYRQKVNKTHWFCIMCSIKM